MGGMIRYFHWQAHCVSSSEEGATQEMDRKIKQILNIVVVIAVILWVLNVFGVFSTLRGIPVGR